MPSRHRQDGLVTGVREIVRTTHTILRVDGASLMLADAARARLPRVRAWQPGITARAGYIRVHVRAS
jgi:hypothetical protein